MNKLSRFVVSLLGAVFGCFAVSAATTGAVIFTTSDANAFVSTFPYCSGGGSSPATCCNDKYGGSYEECKHCCYNTFFNTPKEQDCYKACPQVP